jgi:hypothetical protein
MLHIAVPKFTRPGYFLVEPETSMLLDLAGAACVRAKNYLVAREVSEPRILLPYDRGEAR